MLLPIVLADQPVILSPLFMEQDTEILDELEVVGKIPVAVQLGDTTQYNASAFKTNPDANAEDLVRKMPGVTLENGVVKAQGEEVKKVLVDGKAFFGDDPAISLKNLPAEVIDKVQIFDQKSEQAQFTGFDDGDETKTINIVTKKNMRNGKFGRISGSYGTEDRYALNGNINFFNGDRRVSVVGMANNINQQNFSSEDLIGASSGGGRRGGRGRDFGGGGNNFLVGQQNGLSTTQSAGINYTDNWGKKVEVTGSYFFNHSQNVNYTLLNREYFLEGDSSQFYTEESDGNSANYNHRLDFRLDYNIDSSNALMIRPRLSYQQNDQLSKVAGITLLNSENVINSSQSRYSADAEGLNFSNDILFRHKFSKEGRTLSVGVENGINSKDGLSYLNSTNKFYKGESERVDSTSQERNTNSRSNNIEANIAYTEPIGKKNQLMIDYKVSYTESNSDQNVYSLEEESERMRLDSSLSNTFENTYVTHRTGVDLNRRGENYRIRVGVDYQLARLNGVQVFPFHKETNKTFNSLLPTFMYSYEFSKQKNFRLFYRSFTRAPSVSQLQNVVDNTNPLQLKIGNPELRQQYSHFLMGHYSAVNPEKSSNVFAYINASYTNDYITNATFLAPKDSVLQEGVTLYEGSQLFRPVNLEGSWSARSYFSYGSPLSLLKSNFSLNTGINYSRTPGLINNRKNLSESWQFSQGLSLSSNISKELDFNLSTTANYNLVNNTLQPELNNNYFTQSSSLRFKWIFWKGLTIESDISHTFYSGLDGDFDPNVVLLNLGIGKRVFKNQRGEIKLSVFDLLNENNNISRTVTETYVDDTETRSIRRYALLTFSYNLRNFKGGGSEEDFKRPAPGFGRPPRPDR